jgi:hypothetical protein
MTDRTPVPDTTDTCPPDNRTGHSPPIGWSVRPSLSRSNGWELIHHNPRTLIVTCSDCQRGVVNETNQMRRAKWEELQLGRHRLYRCGRCSERQRLTQLQEVRT